MLLNSGADKVSINTAAVETPELITNVAEIFGNQEVVVSIDAKMSDCGFYEVYIEGGRTATGLDVREWAKEAQSRGAGEILLNSIDNDGAKKGYDTALLSQVTSEVNIPVIALGGVGKIEHFPAAIIEGGADAAAAANIFHHIEQSTIQAKEAMRRCGISVRKCDDMYSDKVLHSTSNK
jgi:cyclase